MEGWRILTSLIHSSSLILIFLLGGLQMNQADKFGFPFTSKVVNKVIKRKKEKSEVFHGVLKVISKMLEENEKFRGRLLTCSQFNTEGSDVNQSSQNEASCMDRDESIFGWV
ncbi:uncharacterized protein C5orf47 homolog [Terrapene carolina triunguis]|uniref:uncharacterized protein C5orf47 homolog n=1 Tax=Terrapene triunguis TaxID=2587831 RepID=UPI0011567688|nr:uncharacterized protein C5orf47 homolog [Terrapene carolina triunguis]